MSDYHPEIARWDTRLVAFVIDCMVMLALVFLVAVVMGLQQDDFGYEPEDEFVMAFLVSLLSLGYLTGMEYMFGTTAGRRAMGLRVSEVDGKRPALWRLLLSNFGKTHVLLIDVIAGMILARRTRQRIFAKWAGVFVVRTDEARMMPG